MVRSGGQEQKRKKKRLVEELNQRERERFIKLGKVNGRLKPKMCAEKPREPYAEFEPYVEFGLKA